MKRIYVFLALGILNLNTIMAQTCSNEEIRFRETFGASSQSIPLPAGRTNYIYKASSITDGEYKLSKTSNGRPEWHNATDHTGDANGLMMVTNASYTPGEFYRDTVEGISPIATYLVYLYVMNVNKAENCSNIILPRLEMVIESYNSDGSFSPLASIISNNIPVTSSPTWLRVDGFFNVPEGVTAVRYRIINNATGGCGNDLAIDDITFAQCAPLMLPVSGLKLQANKGVSSTELSWSTLEEINTDRFLVEKSDDGKNWRTLSSVQAAGESRSKQYYAFTDHTSSAAVVYYRIQAVDRDNKSSFSNSVIVRSSSFGARQSAFPNPFANSLSVEVAVEEHTQGVLRLIDINGKIQRSFSLNMKPGVNIHTVANLESLGAGLYFLDMIDNNGRILFQSKLLKART